MFTLTVHTHNCKTIRLRIHTLFLSLSLCLSHSPPSSRLYLVVTTSNVVMTSYAQVHDTTFTHNVQLTQYCFTSDLHFLLYQHEIKMMSPLEC